MKPKFHENWFWWRKAKNFREQLERWQPIPGDVIEVGCWEGRSTTILANIVAPRPVYVVDHFGGGAASDIERERAAARSVEQQFRVNMAALTPGNVQLSVTDWRPWFAAYPHPGMEGTIAILHIDADHTYVEVRDNLHAAMPYLRPGSLVLGDDMTMREVARAVREVFPDVQHDAATWWYTIPGGG